MRRRYKANAAPAAPPATDLASDGYPGEGDVSRGVPATIPGPYWYYVVTEQIVRTILASGVRAVDLTDDPDQFVTALKNLAKAQTPYADNAEALAGALTDKAINPATLKHVIEAVIGGAPGALDTLNELAAALNDDADFHATITNALALKAPLASPGFTGNPTAPTQAKGNNSTRLATTAFVKRASDAVKDVVLASDIDLTAGTRATQALSANFDDFRWIKIIAGDDEDDYQYGWNVPRAAVTNAAVSDLGLVFLAINNNDNTVGLFSINSQTAAVSQIGQDRNLDAGDYIGAGLASNGRCMFVAVVDRTPLIDRVRFYKTDGQFSQLMAVGNWQNLSSNSISGAGLFFLGTELILAIVDSQSDTVVYYTVDMRNGALASRWSSQSTGDAASAGVDIGVLASGETGIAVIVEGSGSDHVSVFSIDLQTGAISQIGNNQRLGSNLLGGVGVAVRSSVAYATIRIAGNLGLYTINQATGVLASVGAAYNLDGHDDGIDLENVVLNTGGAALGQLLVDRSGNAEAGLTATQSMRIHQMVGVV